MSETTKKKNFLLEIYVENIPARFIISAKKQMEELSKAFLSDKKLSFGNVYSYGTYNRLVLFIEDVPVKTSERLEVFYGPSAKMLKDENGNFTKQAAGFAASFKITPEKLKVAVLEKKGEVLSFERKINPVSSQKILSELVLNLVKNLKFPKNMIWEESRLRFARPIRNFLCVYGNSPVSFKIAQVKSSKVTFGLSSTGAKKISVKSADSYLKLMEKGNVIIKDEERKNKILSDLKHIGENMKISVAVDEDLIEENVYLTEYPSCVPVKYSNEFLALPKELITLVMKKQLKFFPCFKGSQTYPFFVGIRDGISKGHKNVEEGFLNVFEARCRDAIFFYENDLKISASSLKEKISAIVFQEKLGTMSEKSLRVVENCDYLCSSLNLPKKNEILEAAKFSYLDLASNVVREFPELQGIMSGYYAQNWGLSQNQASWLKEFYAPVLSTDSLPSSIESCIISMSAKMDNLAGDFALDMIPTGSQDPHGLRRQAQAIVRIMLENGIKSDLKKFCSFAFGNLPFEIEGQDKKICELMEFFWARTENLILEKGYSLQISSALKDLFLAQGDIVSVFKRAEALNKISSSSDFAVVSTLYKRVKNILKNAEAGLKIQTDIFEKDQEKKLYEKICLLEQKISPLLKEEDFYSALKETENLKMELEDFFKEVMVMCEDSRLRENRLALLNSAVILFERIADISKMQ